MGEGKSDEKDTDFGEREPTDKDGENGEGKENERSGNLAERKEETERRMGKGEGKERMGREME